MKLAAIDLDGTLLHSDCTISQFSKETIKEAASKGIIVVPTSGRSFRNIQKQIKQLDGVQYCICGNGSLVANVITEEILYNHKIPSDTAYDLYEKIHSLGGFVQIYSDTDAYVENNIRHILYKTKLGSAFCESLLSTDIPILSANLLLKRGLMGVNKFHAAFTEPAKMKEFAAYCQEKAGIIVTYPSEYNMEIFAEGSNKDIGMQVLCEHCRIKRQDTIAIGDSDNDVSMIQYANIGVAVENSMDVLKESADFITKSNDDDGPAIVLKKILEKM